MKILYLNNVLSFSNESLVYFYLLVLYLFGFSKYFKIYSNYNINDIDNKMINTINCVISFMLLVLLFTKNIVPSLKLILLLIVFLFYNRSIYLLNFQKSLLTSTLYCFFCFISKKIFSFLLEPEIIKGSINSMFLIVIYHIMVLTVFILSMYGFWVPTINNGVLSEIIYPTDKKSLILYITLIFDLINIPILNLIFDYSPSINNMFFIKIFYILEIIYIFYITYFFSIKSVKRKINIDDEKEALTDDLMLSSSAKYEDNKLKYMNENVRKYSSVLKSNVNINDNYYIYDRVQNALNNFYDDYYTEDEILNELMSEKSMMCKELNIVFLLDIIEVNTSGIDKSKLKCYYAILSLMIDIFVINLYKQKTTNKALVLSLIKFGQGLFLQINHNVSFDKNIMYIKNEILKSDRYKYLDILVKQNNGNIKVNTIDDMINLIVKCK